MSAHDAAKATRLVRALLDDVPRKAAIDALQAAGYTLGRYAPREEHPPITPAERRVLAAILAGKSAKAIATKLGISHFTVNNHTRKLFAAFDVHSRSELIARCASLGVTA